MWRNRGIVNLHPWNRYDFVLWLLECVCLCTCAYSPTLVSNVALSVMHACMHVCMYVHVCVIDQNQKGQKRGVETLRTCIILFSTGLTFEIIMLERQDHVISVVISVG